MFRFVAFVIPVTHINDIIIIRIFPENNNPLLNMYLELSQGKYQIERNKLYDDV
jgi:hypothetical protein